MEEVVAAEELGEGGVAEEGYSCCLCVAGHRGPMLGSEI